MRDTVKWLAMATVLALVITGCGTKESGKGNGTGGEGAQSEQPAVEAPQALPEAAEDQPAESDASEIGVEQGDTVEIATTIEGMEEQVEVKEYTLTPHNIHYQLRTLFGAPSVENGKVVHSAKMGEQTATITIEVHEGLSLDEAFDKATSGYTGGFDSISLDDIPAGTSAYPGRFITYVKEQTVSGAHVFDVKGKAVIVHRSYPAEAGDGMAAIMAEFMKSLKAE